MSTLLALFFVVAAFVAGLLVGRRNPKVADKAAELANEAKAKAPNLPGI